MRKFVLLLAILALPGLAMAQPQLDVSSPSAVGGVITVDLNALAPITIDVSCPATSTVTSTMQYSLTAGAADAGLDFGGLAHSAILPPAQYFQLMYFGGVANMPALIGQSMAVVNTTVAEGYNMTLPCYGAVATWTLNPNASLAAGSYTISADQLVWPQNSIDGVPFTGIGQTLTLNVVPEPATALLLLGALPFLRRRR